MSFECFRRFPIGFVHSIQICPLGVRNAFSYANEVRLEGSKPKAIMKFIIQACATINSVSLRTQICKHK